ncbi:cation transporter [Fulvivirga kasyanovii]|uniref:Cation transporter n=1 Tax=Fulvivirga kasyanovii TaxID=396812 RepID=A0ABW9RL91_9BACT|nr:cation transporter [Fulvivirga kasyanovii]MTI24597.1 cation transporter [Fulvivirga kasyanovii]
MGEERDKGKFINTESHELPPAQKEILAKGKKLEWITIFYLVTVIVSIYFVLGSSQAMKAAFLEDVLSIVPSVLFLIAYFFYDRRTPDHRYLYGLHKVFSVAFLLGSFALLGIGLFSFYDSSIALLKREHPTIGNIYIFGYSVWLGWVMILALLWSFIPAMILGRKKLPIAKKLHNKILFTDANTQKADWMTAGAAIIGIIGIGFGLWWADSVMAILISLSIMKDGFTRTKGAITDIIEQIPTKIDKDDEKHPLDFQIYWFFKNKDWVKDVRIRLRENGAVFFGEVFIIPSDPGMHADHLIDKIEEAYKEVRKIDWKVHDITIQPVKAFK